MKINLDKFTERYLEAFGRLFGYDAEWAAQHYIRNGITKDIENGTLRKASAEFALAKKITRPGDQK